MDYWKATGALRSSGLLLGKRYFLFLFQMSIAFNGLGCSSYVSCRVSMVGLFCRKGFIVVLFYVVLCCYSSTSYCRSTKTCRNAMSFFGRFWSFYFILLFCCCASEARSFGKRRCNFSISLFRCFCDSPFVAGAEKQNRQCANKQNMQCAPSNTCLSKTFIAGRNGTAMIMFDSNTPISVTMQRVFRRGEHLFYNI